MVLLAGLNEINFKQAIDFSSANTVYESLSLFLKETTLIFNNRSVCLCAQQNLNQQETKGKKHLLPASNCVSFPTEDFSLLVNSQVM